MGKSKFIKLAEVSLVTLLFAACSPTVHQADSSTAQSGIRLGETAEKTDLVAKSTVAVIGGNMQSVCSGTLLENNYVLTAAHCIQPGLPMYVVFSTNATELSAYRKADAIAIHPEYIHELQDARGNVALNRADIALIHFAGSIPEDYEAAAFLAEMELLKSGEYVVIAGYGVAEDFPVTRGPIDRPSDLVGSGTGLLRFARVMIEDPEFSDTEITLDQKWGKGACQGDSGGPAYLVRDGKALLWGVASWGKIRTKDSPCLQTVVYTTVLPHVDFIEGAAAAIAKELNGRRAARATSRRR